MNRIRRNQLVRVHLQDNTSVEGRVCRRARRYLVLSAAKVEESSGAWHELASERLLIPHERVKLVEIVVGP